MINYQCPDTAAYVSALLSEGRYLLSPCYSVCLSTFRRHCKCRMSTCISRVTCFNCRLIYTTMTQGRRQVKICGVDRHGERGVRAYNGGLEAEPPAGSRVDPPYLSACKNSSDLYQFQERPLAKVWVGMSTPVHPVATPLL